MLTASGDLDRLTAARLDSMPAAARDRVVSRLRTGLEQMQRDVALALAQLDGPDPEAAAVTLAGAIESGRTYLP